MSQLQNILLQPVAQPTNQSYAPAVKPPQRGNDLLDLANALSQVNPELNQIAERQLQAHVQNSQLRGEADAAKYQNISDFSTAVKNGQIAEADNPWYMTAIKQAVAGNQARADGVNLRNAYYSDPIQFDDNPQNVQAWLKSKAAPALDGMDMWERATYEPIINDAIDRTLTEHVKRRRVEREDELSAAYQQDIGNIINDSYGQYFAPFAQSVPISPDQSTAPQQTPTAPSAESASFLSAPQPTTQPTQPSAGNGQSSSVPSIAPTTAVPTPIPAATAARSANIIGQTEDVGYRSAAVDQVASKVQNNLTNLGRLMPYSKANALTLQALADAAIANNDPSIFEQVAARVGTAPGATLLDSPGARDMLARIRHAVITQQAEEQSIQQRQQELVDHDAAQKLMAAGWAALDQKRQTDPTATLFDVTMTPDQMLKAGVSPSVIQQFRQMAAQSTAEDSANAELKQRQQDQQDKQSVLDLGQKLFNANDPTEVNNIAGQLFHLVGGSSEAVDVQRFKYELKQAANRQSDPTAVDSLLTAWGNGQLTPKMVLDALPHLSQDDAHKYLSTALSAQSSDPGLFGKDGMAQLEAKQISQRVMVQAMVNAGETQLTGDDQRPGFRENNPSAYTAASIDADDKAYQFLDKYNTWLIDPANANATPQAKQAKLKEISASIIDPNIKMPPPVPPVQPPESKDPPIDSAVEDVTKYDPVIGRVSHNDLATLKDVVDKRVTVPRGESDPTQYAVVSGIPSVWRGPFAPDVRIYNGDDPLKQLRAYRASAFDRSFSNYTFGPGPRDLNAADPTEVKLYNAAMQQRLALKQAIVGENTVQNLKAKLARSQKYPIDFNTKRDIVWDANKIREYALLTSEVGMTPDEVKQLGGDAWLHVPMFANIDDLKQRGEAVAKQLGLKTEDDAIAFTKAQVDLYNQRIKALNVD